MTFRPVKKEVVHQTNLTNNKIRARHTMAKITMKCLIFGSTKELKCEKAKHSNWKSNAIPSLKHN